MSSSGRTFVIGIDGRSGTGKSTLAATLVHALAASPAAASRAAATTDTAAATGTAATTDAALIGLDDLYRGWDGLDQAPPRLLEWVLEPLAAGLPARYRPYDWATGEYSRHWREVGRPSILVVEGVGALARPVRAYLDLGIWLTADEPTRYARAMARDGATFRPHWQRWAAQEDAYLRADDPAAAADVIVRA